MNPIRMLSIRKNSEISEYSKIYPFSIITNSKIGSFSYVSYFCKINNSTIGKFCSIAQNVKMGLGVHPINYLSTSPIFYSPQNPLKIRLLKNLLFEDHIPIIIHNDVWIGTNVSVLDGVTIGDGAIIGANSVVTKDVDSYSIVGGVPAKEIRKRFDSDLIEELLELKWWDCPIEKLKQGPILELFSTEVNASTIRELIRCMKNP